MPIPILCKLCVKSVVPATSPPVPTGNDVFSASIRSVYAMEAIQKDLTPIYETNDSLETFSTTSTENLMRE